MNEQVPAASPHSGGPPGQHSPDLTERQRHVLRLVMAGAENKEIAGSIGVSESAVKAIVSRLLETLGVNNRASLAAMGTVLEIVGEPAAERARLRYLFSRAPVMICVMRGPQLIFEMANPAYCHGVGDRPLIGRPFREAFPELAGQGIYELLETVVRTGEPFRAHELTARWDAKGTGPEDGFANAVWYPVHDENGAVDGLIAYTVDVTAEVHARRQVEEQMGWQSAVVDDLAQGVIVLDDVAQVRLVNGSARRLLDLVDGAIAAGYADLLDLRSPTTGRPLSLDEHPLMQALSGTGTRWSLFALRRHGTTREFVARMRAAPLRIPERRANGAIAYFSAVRAPV